MTEEGDVAALAAELRALRAEVRYLRDRQDITDVVNRYTRGLDRLDTDILTEVFWPDAIDNHTGFVGTRAEFLPFAIEVESKYAATHHGCTTHNCEIAGDVAHAETYVHWFLRQKDSSMVRAGGGRYLDRLERRSGQWKIVLRRIYMDWQFEADGTLWDGNVKDFNLGSRDKTDPSYQRPLRLEPELEAKLKR